MDALGTQLLLDLEECNRERRSIQSTMMQVAQNKVEFLGGDQGSFIFVDDENLNSENTFPTEITITAILKKASSAPMPGISILFENLTPQYGTLLNDNVITDGQGTATTTLTNIITNNLESSEEIVEKRFWL